MKYLVIVLSALLLSACGSGTPSPENPANPSQPTAPSVFEDNQNFALAPASGFNALEREWDIELDYATSDIQAVFDLYDADLAGQGFTRTSLETEDGEFEADYRRDNLLLELEIERDDGSAEVDFDLTESAPVASNAFSLTEVAGVSLPEVNAGIAQVDWDFNIDYDTSDLDAIFAHYDAALASLGWSRSDLEREDDEIEADYRKNGVELELEVSLDDGEVEVDIELNKALFY